MEFVEGAYSLGSDPKSVTVSSLEQLRQVVFTGQGYLLVSTTFTTHVDQAHAARIELRPTNERANRS